MDLNKAIKTLKENKIEFETERGQDQFYFTAIMFENKRVATKAAKILFPEGTTLITFDKKRYGFQFYG